MTGWLKADDHFDPKKFQAHFEELRKHQQSNTHNIETLERKLFKEEKKTRQLMTQIYHHIANNQSTEHLLSNLSNHYNALQQLLFPESEVKKFSDLLALMSHTYSMCDAVKELITHLSNLNSRGYMHGLYTFNSYKINQIQDGELGHVYRKIAIQNVILLERLIQIQVLYINSSGLPDNTNQLLEVAKVCEEKMYYLNAKIDKFAKELKTESEQITKLIVELSQEQKNHNVKEVTKHNLSKHLETLQHIIVPSQNCTFEPSDVNGLLNKAKKWNQASVSIQDHSFRLTNLIRFTHNDMERVAKVLELLPTDQDLTEIYQTIMVYDVSIMQVLLTNFQNLLNQN